MLQIKAVVRMQIDKEIECIKKAIDNGNIGKARVCARRGAGLAINYWRGNNYGDQNISALSQLNWIKDDASVPDNIKKAAEKLTIKVSGAGHGEISENPFEDCVTIVEYCLR